eukprot:CAMPEP_0168405256 /NCGR_PEP_ID=MMETSP0228-20121227/25050_1 /TAXON_ID=133427 /ORGANISM="Protoceratium reticulatum, Strain CCCM 535 (=CCMP 1889)" /LENGTH=47 /DNA_ID= /DNA_START= /DNA_END= /DNA_ORIENTATION=
MRRMSVGRHHSHEGKAPLPQGRRRSRRVVSLKRAPEARVAAAQAALW